MVLIARYVWLVAALLNGQSALMKDCSGMKLQTAIDQITTAGPANTLT